MEQSLGTFWRWGVTRERVGTRLKKSEKLARADFLAFLRVWDTEVRDNVVEMTANYMRRKEDAEFEQAFAAAGL